MEPEVNVEEQECWSCGYVLAIHTMAYPHVNPVMSMSDPHGGCPADEIDAMRRWGLM